MFSSSRPTDLTKLSRPALWVWVLFPALPTAFVVWLFTLTGIDPQKPLRGLAAYALISAIVIAPWVWYAAQCGQELRRRRRGGRSA